MPDMRVRYTTKQGTTCHQYDYDCVSIALTNMLMEGYGPVDSVDDSMDATIRDFLQDATEEWGGGTFPTMLEAIRDEEAAEALLIPVTHPETHEDFDSEKARGLLEHIRGFLENERECELECGDEWEAQQWLDAERKAA